MNRSRFTGTYIILVSLALTSLAWLVSSLGVPWLCLHHSHQKPLLQQAPVTASPGAKSNLDVPEGKPSPTRVFYKDRVMVLMFHNVSPDYQSKGTITPKAFAADIETLLSDGYNIISVDTLASYLEGKQEVPPNAVVLTFDDGYAGMYNYVFPVLKRFNAPAIVFLITGHIGTNSNYLTWDQVREMDASGLFTFGGHTHKAHYKALTSPWTRAPASVAHIYQVDSKKPETDTAYQERMLADSLECQRSFEQELGYTTPYFAYPYGGFTPELTNILRSAGFRYFFTTLSGANRRGQDPCFIYRINVGMEGMSSSNVARSVRYLARLSFYKRPLPSTWLPRWAEDPSLEALYISQ